MKNLERAIRIYRALVESPVKVDSSSLRSWDYAERALAHAPVLLTEMRELPADVRARVFAYVSEFSPLVESRPIFVLPGREAVNAFIKEVESIGGNASCIDNGGLVAATGTDMRFIESTAARLGGTPYKGPSLADAFERVDTTLPEAMMLSAGLSPELCEQSLIAALYRTGNNKLTESRLFAGFKLDGALDRFKDRLASFARPKPVLGVSRRLAEAVRISGLATPEMVKLLEAGDPPGGGAVGSGNSGVKAPGGSDRGGIAKDQPDSRGSSPANSKNGEQKQQTPPTEHVPSQEQGGATNAIRLPDGTEVPMDVMRQAFGKMLHNMATQVEQGTVGGQPSPRGADQMDAAGAEPPQTSVPQQQVAAQSASQQAAGNGAEPANGQPPVANGQPGPGAPPANGSPPANGEQQPPQGQQQQAQQPGQQQAQPGGDVEGLLAKAEQGDEAAFKQVQGMQGQMNDQQKQRLQAIIAKKQGGNGAPPANGNGAPPPPAQGESHATLRRAMKMLESVRERDLVAGLALVRRAGLVGQPFKLVERVQDKLALLVTHQSEAVRNAAKFTIIEEGSKVIFETSRASEASAAGREFVGREIKKLTTSGPSKGPEKGRPYPQKRAVAAALNVARDKGYKVGKKPSEGVQESRQTFARTTQGDGFVVWERAQVIPAGTLPQGLAYGTSVAKPGTSVAVLERLGATSVVRLPNGDIVRVPSANVVETVGSGYIADQLVETRDLQGMMGTFAKGGVKQAVVVAGSPTSGRGYFIRTKLAPWARRLGERVATAPFPSLESLSGESARREAITEMRLATAREDHTTLAGAVDEAEFDQALVADPRFRHVVEGRGTMLRDAIPWRMFQSCRESFDRFYAIPAVRKYYESMGATNDRVMEGAIKRMVGERKAPAFVQMGGVLVVDAPALSDIAKIAETAADAGFGVTLVEMRLDLDTVLKRGGAAKLRETRLIKNYNTARRAVDEARRSSRISRFVTYTWRSAGGPFDGKFVCEDATMPNPTDVVKLKKGVTNIDGEQGAIKPKSIAVPAVENRKLREQLDVGQAAESESCANGMKEAGEQLKAAREAVFKLTAETLVKCAAMAQATNAKRTQKELAKAQQLAATFLDDIQALAAQVDKANEVMKGENGGMGGDNVDAMKQMQAAGANGNGGTPAAAPPAPGATPALSPAGAGAPPAPPAGGVPPAAIESVSGAVAFLLDTDIPDRIAQGADYRSLNEAVSGYCPRLSVHERVAAIDRIKTMLSIPPDASIKVQFNPVDHRLLSEAVSFGSLAGVLVSRTRDGMATYASAGELRHAVESLRKYGKSPHMMLANTLDAAVGGRGSLSAAN